MSDVHIVKPGDHLSRIAHEHGFSDHATIWEHPDNADLASQRRDPHILLPGDRVHVPTRTRRTEAGATEQRHRFRVKHSPLKLAIVVRDFADQPIAFAEGSLQVDMDIHDLTTDGSGRIEQVIAGTAEAGALTVGPIESPIRIGHLDPIEEVSGQAGRLSNLGYFHGGSPAEQPDAFSSAIEEFQCDHALSVDGICGPKTRTKLEDVHGC